MTKIPLRYNIRNIVVRWRSNLMTALSIALVIAVFIIVMSIPQGLRDSFISSGEPLNVLVLRQGSTAETTSFVTKETFRIIQYLHGIKKSPTGKPIIAGELTVMMNLAKKNENLGANVLIRGVGEESFLLHPQVKIVEGRLFKPGLREVIVSRALSKSYLHMNIGDNIWLGKGLWTVVGKFDAGKTAFDSEVWGDSNEIGVDFDRETYSSVLLRAEDKESQNRLINFISSDPKLNLKAKTEADHYKESTSAAVPLQILGSFLAITMSLGSIFAAINTMYASVANRTKEIGTLRVLGFKPRNILFSFLLESLMLSFIGGIVGCLLAYPFNGMATHTANFSTFTDVTFNFRITPMLQLKGLIFSLIIGTLGGILPAINAARRPVIAALREIE